MLLVWGDSLEKLKELKDSSIDSVVTDPPYGLSFMGKKWDYDVPSVELWREVLRVLKPGGHLLSFGGTRTYHRMVVNIEDAGFEIRDQIMWIYGSGFPKSLDVSKAIDKAAGATREKLKRTGKTFTGSNNNIAGITGEFEVESNIPITATATATAWQGWGTALKPANEPIVLARKPIEKGLTVAENVLKWGCGGLNIDGTRIAHNEECKPMKSQVVDGEMTSQKTFGNGGRSKDTLELKPNGRWPANVLFDEEAAAMLDEQSGPCKTGGKNINTDCGDSMFGKRKVQGVMNTDNGTGASRFFYVAKASKRERGLGLDKHAMFKVETGQCKDVNTAAAQLLQKVMSGSMVKWLTAECGERITVIFPQECKSIIEMEISRIIESKTLSLLTHSLTSESTPDALMDISHAESVASLRQFLLNTTGGETALALGAAHAASATLQRISGSAELKPFSNFHSTVKPIRLMEYLIKLVTPPNGQVLDPFMGSGSTGCAAVKLGFNFIGIEREQEYVEIAKRRIEHWKQEVEETCPDEKNQLTMNI